MIHLPTVDLVITEGIDAKRIVPCTINTIGSLKLNSSQQIIFRRVILFAPTLPDSIRHIVDEFHERRWDYEGWNKFMTKELKDYVPDGHCLNIHHDGYILNASNWTNKFLKYDYIGAPWASEHGYAVGNGGFSLRSKAYLEATATFDLPEYAPEDHRMIRQRGSFLEDMNIKFAPVALAHRFSFEGHDSWGHEWDGQFGFHGPPDRTNIDLYYERNPDALRPV